jgi:hypothetical protein
MHRVYNKSDNNQPQRCKGGERVGAMGGVVWGGGVMPLPKETLPMFLDPHM